MALYLRFSSDIQADIERGTDLSYTGLDNDFIETAEEIAKLHMTTIDKVVYNNGWCVVKNGISAFKLKSENIEDAIEEAKSDFRRMHYDTSRTPDWHIIEADVVSSDDDCVYVNHAVVKFSANEKIMKEAREEENEKIDIALNYSSKIMETNKFDIENKQREIKKITDSIAQRNRVAKACGFDMKVSIDSAGGFPVVKMGAFIDGVERAESTHQFMLFHLTVNEVKELLNL